MLSDSVVHLIAGGVGGTAGAVVTCPLEVVKTRLQSSAPPYAGNVPTTTAECSSRPGTSAGCSRSLMRLSPVLQYSSIPRRLHTGRNFRLLEVVRAIYFLTYSTMKSRLNNMVSPDTPAVHVLSAATAGFLTCTCTNPLWLVKTRLQLDTNTKHPLTAAQCIHRVWKDEGLRGFYRGVTASYAGISETVIHFVIYEQLKALFLDDNRAPSGFPLFMACGATSKLFAATLAYPHELARTRLREEGHKYRTFWQTLRTVYTEESFRGLYRGLTVHLMRQIPNTAVILATYEVVVDLLKGS